MKKYKNYLFVENGIDSVIAYVSDGYIRGFNQDESKRIKLPHNNYTLLGIVDECINAPYAEEFSAEIVEKDELSTAVESMKTLIEKLNLKPTDYILRDES